MSGLRMSFRRGFWGRLLRSLGRVGGGLAGSRGTLFVWDRGEVSDSGSECPRAWGAWLSGAAHHFVPGDFALFVDGHLAEDAGEGAFGGADADVLGFAGGHVVDELG